jgi:hypothetical protein
MCAAARDGVRGDDLSGLSGGANLDSSYPDPLLKMQTHYFNFLSSEHQASFMEEVGNAAA